jgi:beta-galactosidase
VQTPGIPAKFVIKNDPKMVVDADWALVEKHPESISISLLPTGFNHGIQIRLGNGHQVELILLSSQEAEDAWKTNVDGSSHLLQTDRDFFADENSFVLLSEGDAHCGFTLYPTLNGSLKLTSGGSLSFRPQGKSTRFNASVSAERPVLEMRKIKEAGKVPHVKLGPPLPWRTNRVAMAPNSADFELADMWAISVPRYLQSNTVNNLFLQIDYAGDVARLSANGSLLDDNFNNGVGWTIGLRRFTRMLSNGPLELSILPLRRDAPIFLEKRFWPSFHSRGQVGDLKSATLIPQYKFQFQIGLN